MAQILSKQHTAENFIACAALCLDDHERSFRTNDTTTEQCWPIACEQVTKQVEKGSSEVLQAARRAAAQAAAAQGGMAQMLAEMEKKKKVGQGHTCVG